MKDVSYQERRGCVVTSDSLKNMYRPCPKKAGDGAHLGAHHDVDVEVILDVGLNVRHAGVLWRKERATYVPAPVD